MASSKSQAVLDLIQAILAYGRATAVRIGSGRAAWRQALAEQATTPCTMIGAANGLPYRVGETPVRRAAYRVLGQALRHQASITDLARMVVTRQLRHAELASALWLSLPGLSEAEMDQTKLDAIRALHRNGETQAADALLRQVSKGRLWSLIMEPPGELPLPFLLKRQTHQPDLAMWKHVARHGDPAAMAALIRVKNPLTYLSYRGMHAALAETLNGHHTASMGVLWPWLAQRSLMEVTAYQAPQHWRHPTITQQWDTVLALQAGVIQADPALTHWRDQLVEAIGLKRLPQETARRQALARAEELAQAVAPPVTRRRKRA